MCCKVIRTRPIAKSAVSNNFKFGRKRKGDINLLKNFSYKYDFQLLNVQPFKYKGKIVSSTRIRKCLQRGNIYLANKLLSRTWFIDGIVNKGEKLGRKLGYRTCNICIKNYILPKLGIYAVKVLIGNKKKIYNGVAYLGRRPTFKGKEIFLETNIFGIKENLYKKKLGNLYDQSSYFSCNNSGNWYSFIYENFVFSFCSCLSNANFYGPTFLFKLYFWS